MANPTRRITELAVLLAALYCARRRYRNWGATKGECETPLPGDALVADPVVQTTEAVYIDASPSTVWPWLLRMAGIQSKRPGDVVRLTPEGWMGSPKGMTASVSEIVPEKHIVLDASRSRPRWDAMWSFHLEPHLTDQTRLLCRARIGLRHPGEVFAVELARPVIALSMRGLLLGIKQAVEQQGAANLTEAHSAPDSAAGERPNGPIASSSAGIISAGDMTAMPNQRRTKMTTAREVMNAGVTCIGEDETLSTAAQHMREHNIGALPICGNDNRLHGMLTDRDIVIKGVAAGLDPTTTTAGQLARDSVYYVDADASIHEMLNVMEEHQIRRLPVLDDDRLVGIVSEADIARHLPEHAVVEFVRAICSPAAITS